AMRRRKSCLLLYSVCSNADRIFPAPKGLEAMKKREPVAVLSFSFSIENFTNDPIVKESYSGKTKRSVKQEVGTKEVNQLLPALRRMLRGSRHAVLRGSRCSEG